jgi:cation transport ATPase
VIASAPDSPSSPARRREEQGRLFWVWLLSLPIILLLAAERAFGAAWPNPLTQKIAMVMLAYPVLFVVGEPLLHEGAAAWQQRRASPAVLAAAAALACYVSGALATFTSAPPIAGHAALLVAAYLTLRYFVGSWAGVTARPQDRARNDADL